MDQQMGRWTLLTHNINSSTACRNRLLYNANKLRTRLVQRVYVRRDHDLQSSEMYKSQQSPNLKWHLHNENIKSDPTPSRVSAPVETPIFPAAPPVWVGVEAEAPLFVPLVEP